MLREINKYPILFMVVFLTIVYIAKSVIWALVVFILFLVILYYKMQILLLVKKLIKRLRLPKNLLNTTNDFEDKIYGAYFFKSKGKKYIARALKDKNTNLTSIKVYEVVKREEKVVYKRNQIENIEMDREEVLKTLKTLNPLFEPKY